MFIDGLRPLEKDARDIPLGGIFSLPDLSTLPADFSLLDRDYIPRDQEAEEESDYCTAYASCLASELQEGVKLSPRFSFAISKWIAGDVDGFGVDLRSALKAHTKYGAVEEAWLSDKELLMDSSKARRIEEYRASLLEMAKGHKKQTYLSVTGPYDHFDNARASTWKFKDNKQAILFGVQFGWPLETVVLDTMPQGGFGHCMAATGWKDDMLEVTNSAGDRAGDNGRHYMSRDIFNHFVEIYGAMMMVDMPVEVARDMLALGMKDTDGFFTKLLKTIKHYL